MRFRSPELLLGLGVVLLVWLYTAFHFSSNKDQMVEMEQKLARIERALQAAGQDADGDNTRTVPAMPSREAAAAANAWKGKLQRLQVDTAQGGTSLVAAASHTAPTLCPNCPTCPDASFAASPEAPLRPPAAAAAAMCPPCPASAALASAPPAPASPSLHGTAELSPLLLDPSDAASVQYRNFCADRMRPTTDWDTTRYPSTAQAIALAEEIATKAGVRIRQPPATCDADFHAKQLSFFHAHFLGGHVPEEGPLLCQEDGFILDHLAALAPNPHQVFIEVGANKGFDMVDIYARYTNFTQNLVWQRIGRQLHPGCPYFADIDRVVFPTVWAFEPMKGTMQALQRLQAALPLCNLHLIPAAVSGPNAPKTATFVANQPGDEVAHILWPGESAANYNSAHSHTVDVVTLDAFRSAHGIGHVSALFVDTEGNDPKVLAGADHLLSSGAVDVVVMEYGGGMEDEAGNKVSLRAHSQWMEARGLDSYYIGPSQSLVKISGEGCWSDTYETTQTSNILHVRKGFALAHALVLPFLVGGK